jgi:Domain of unknown function (DUF397)
VTLFGWRRRNSKCGNPNPVVEIRADEVIIRDSNDPSRIPLRFSRTQWEALEARRHQFDVGRQSEKYFYASWDPASRTFVVETRPFDRPWKSLRRVCNTVAWILVVLWTLVNAGSSLPSVPELVTGHGCPAPARPHHAPTTTEPAPVPRQQPSPGSCV